MQWHCQCLNHCRSRIDPGLPSSQGTLRLPLAALPLVWELNSSKSSTPWAAGPGEQSVALRANLCSQHTLLAQWRYGSASQWAHRINPSFSACQPPTPWMQSTAEAEGAAWRVSDLLGHGSWCQPEPGTSHTHFLVNSPECVNALNSCFWNPTFPLERSGVGNVFHTPCLAPGSPHWYPQPCQHCISKELEDGLRSPIFCYNSPSCRGIPSVAGNWPLQELLFTSRGILMNWIAFKSLHVLYFQLTQLKLIWFERQSNKHQLIKLTL